MEAVDLTRLRNELDALTDECERLHVMRSATSKVRALISALDVIEEARSRTQSKPSVISPDGEDD